MNSEVEVVGLTIQIPYARLDDAILYLSQVQGMLHRRITRPEETRDTQDIQKISGEVVGKVEFNCRGGDQP